MTRSSVEAGPNLPAAVRTGELLGYGRVSWDQLTAMLNGVQAAWADYDGFHIGTPPASPPPYTHLWAWTNDWLARARIEGDFAIVGVLALNGRPPAAPAVKLTEPVRYQVTRARTWPQDEKRVGELPTEVAGRPIDLYLIPGEHPATFVAVASNA